MNEKNQPGAAAPKTSDAAMLIDGKNIEVTLKHTRPGEAGAMEIVRVRKIPICDMDMLGQTWGKIRGEVMVYLGRDEEFVRSLSEESFIAVLEEGRRLNFTSCSKWFEWQDQTLKALGQEQDRNAMVAEVVKKMDEKKTEAQKLALANP